LRGKGREKTEREQNGSEGEKERVVLLLRPFTEATVCIPRASAPYPPEAEKVRGGGTPIDLQEWFEVGVDLHKLYSN